MEISSIQNMQKKLLLDTNLKIIIFDFDGTIINSNQKKEHALIHAISTSYKIDFNQVKNFIANNPGKNREYYFKHFLKFLSPNKDHSKKLIKANNIFASDVENIYQNAEISNGLLDLKNIFPHSQWFIISSANKEEIIKIIKYRGISYLFEGVYGGPKTKYENFNEHILKLVTSNNEVLHIGDGNQDMEFIGKAGIQGLLLTKWSSEINYLLSQRNNILVMESLSQYVCAVHKKNSAT
jgi:phosphoglycolate phosphatase-like HAD superfamily hydrolase